MLLILLTAAAFGSTIVSSFHFDDYSLLDDRAVTEPGGLLELLSWERTRPLTYATFWANYQIDGAGPAGYHAVNLGLHLAAAVVFWRIARRLAPIEAAQVAAVCFALHPLQTEAVAYVFARATLLAGLLCLLCWWSWLEGRRGWAFGWFVAALLAKEEAAGFLIFLLGWILLTRGGQRELRLAWRPLALMTGAVALALARTVYAAAVTPGAGALFGLGEVTPGRYFLTQSGVILAYISRFFVPLGMNFDSDIALAEAVSAETWILTATIWGIAAAMALLARKRKAWFWPVGALLLLIPTSTVLPLADFYAERRLYLPLAAAGLGLGCVADWALARWRLIPLSGLVVALGLGWASITAARAQVWESEISLWRDTVDKSAGKTRPKLQLARALGVLGETANEERAWLLNEARKREPENLIAAEQDGLFRLEQNDPAAAIEIFRFVIERAAKDARAHNNLGVALLLANRPGDAAAEFYWAIDTDPCRFDARANLIRLYRGLGDAEEVRKAAAAPKGCRFRRAEEDSLAEAQRYGL